MPQFILAACVETCDYLLAVFGFRRLHVVFSRVSLESIAKRLQTLYAFADDVGMGIQGVHADTAIKDVVHDGRQT